MVIVITGPTAVGKTKLSVEIAKRINGEIINADSTQVYRNLNIGTAKVTEEEKMEEEPVIREIVELLIYQELWKRRCMHRRKYNKRFF